MPTPAVALTIAGTDSSGGAGVSADLRTFAALGVHATMSVAALTAQSTTGIDAVHLLPSEFVVAQAMAVLGDLDVGAVKTGFLASAAIVTAVADLARDARLPNLVVDPVLVRADGSGMFPPDVEEAYRRELLPNAAIVTPNRIEAGLLVGRELHTVADMERAACELSAGGAEVVVVKGGDADDEGDESVDVVARAGSVVERLVLPRVSTGNDHGSGCTFSAAVAARLALGDGRLDAVRAAKSFVHAGLVGAAAWRLGAGHGPLDQLGWGS